MLKHANSICGHENYVETINEINNIPYKPYLIEIIHYINNYDGLGSIMVHYKEPWGAY